MCEHHECEQSGDFKAPKSPNQLDQYYWFCQTHAEEYNRGWDYFRGQSQEQAEEELKAGQWHGKRSYWNMEPDAEQSPAVRSAMAILDLTAGDGVNDLKRAYKKKVKEHHPDRGGDPEMFRLITSAYSLLSDHLQST
jgi:DnaJ-domain-containing protein 1